MKKNGFDFDTYGAAYLARDLHKLRVLISEQSDEIFRKAGLSYPSHCSSIVLLLAEAGETPIMMLAKALGYSHQLIIQRLTILEKKGLVCRYKDPEDRRRNLVTLTKKGRGEVQRTKAALATIDKGMSSMMAELGLDLQSATRQARALLIESSLKQRRSRPVKRPKTDRARIVSVG